LKLGVDLKISNRKFLASAILVSAVLAGGVSFYASSSPDGLEKVAEDIGFLDTAKPHANEEFALADYGVAGIENERLSVGLAGLIGVGATALVGLALFRLIGRKSTAKLK
jgi:cobalt/nickel transport protein